MGKIPTETKIKVLATTNPHRAESKDYQKFTKLKSEMTVEKALSAGLDQGYLSYAHKKGWIELEGLGIPKTEPKAKQEVNSFQYKPPSRFKADIYLYNDPEGYPAQLLERGPEQSEIKFANGNRRFVTNSSYKFFKKVETKKQ